MSDICIAITARASFARVKTVIEALIERGERPTVLLAGSAMMDKFGSVRADLRALGVLDVATLAPMEPHGHVGMATHAGLTVIQAAQALEEIQPRKVVVIADRYETLAVSIAAAYQNITLVHLQGGELSGSIDDKVRNANTALADVHCVATEGAKFHIIMGKGRSAVHRTGCPSIDLALRAARNPPKFPQERGIGPHPDPEQPYAIVAWHPDTRLSDGANAAATEALLHDVRRMMNSTGWQIVWIWPNIDAGTDGVSKVLRQFHEQRPNLFTFYRHIEAEHFLALMAHAQAVIGNSSLCVRECSALGVPAVLVGDRQQHRERAGNIRTFDTLFGRRPEPSLLYGDGTAGAQIAEILLS